VWIGATAGDVADYFAWRQSDAARTALSTWCYWTLRQAGRTARQVTADIKGASTAQQNELLYQHGINFNDIPHWQRRRTGLHWLGYQKTGSDPRTGIQATATRRMLHINDQLPVKDEYRALVMQVLTTEAPALPRQPLHGVTSVGAPNRTGARTHGNARLTQQRMSRQRAPRRTLSVVVRGSRRSSTPLPLARCGPPYVRGPRNTPVRSATR
jgi:Thg1 C terminal domain